MGLKASIGANSCLEGFWIKYCTVVCMCVFFPFILGIKFVGRTSGGHTGFPIHLLSAVRALFFLAIRIQPFLSLVDREVEFCKGVFGTVRTEVYRRYFRRYIPYRAFRYARYRLPYHTENFGTLGTALHTLPKISVFEEKIPRVR